MICYTKLIILSYPIHLRSYIQIFQEETISWVSTFIFITLYAPPISLCSCPLLLSQTLSFNERKAHQKLNSFKTRNFLRTSNWFLSKIGQLNLVFTGSMVEIVFQTNRKGSGTRFFSVKTGIYNTAFT